MGFQDSIYPHGSPGSHTVVLGPSGSISSMERPIRYCYWVEPGKLLAGEYPRDLDGGSSEEKIGALKDAGVTTFVDLTEEDEEYLQPPQPYADLAAPAIHRRFPIEDTEIPPSRELTVAALDEIDRTIADGGVAYVHCLGGIGRTGTIIGCWLVRHGRTGEEALEHLAELWKQNPKHKRAPFTPQNEEQCDYVLGWRKGE